MRERGYPDHSSHHLPTPREICRISCLSHVFHFLASCDFHLYSWFACFYMYVNVLFLLPLHPLPPFPLKIFYNKGSFYSKNYQIDTNDGNVFHIFIFASGILSLLWLSLLQLCDHVKYISFNTNLNTRRKERILKSPDCFWSYLSLNVRVAPLRMSGFFTPNFYYLFIKYQSLVCS